MGRWNNQMIGGTKPELVARCVDGHKNGALPECPETDCGGKLKYSSDMKQVFCGGRFNEELAARVKCFFKIDSDKISRNPWRTRALTEEEKEEEEAKKVGVDLSGSKDLFEGLDLITSEGKRAAVIRIVNKAREVGINVPENDTEARTRMGTLLLSNPHAAPEDLLKVAAELYGSKAKDEERKAASGAAVECEANSGIVTALSELSSAYYKTGNSNAGGTYRKAASAIRSLKFAVTSGKAISKGKDKVDGIGAKCGELIDEFLETGEIAKIK